MTFPHVLSDVLLAWAYSAGLVLVTVWAESWWHAKAARPAEVPA